MLIVYHYVPQQKIMTKLGRNGTDSFRIEIFHKYAVKQQQKTICIECVSVTVLQRTTYVKFKLGTNASHIRIFIDLHHENSHPYLDRVCRNTFFFAINN